MATLNEYYLKDFSRLLSVHETWFFQSPKGDKLTVTAKVHLDFDSNTTFISYYLAHKVDNPFELFKVLLNKNADALRIIQSASVESSLPGESKMSSADLRFSGRIFFYYEGIIDAHQFNILQAELKIHGIYIHYRDTNFSIERSKVETPLAFISHDSKDKEEIASKIAIQLQMRMCPVWYDEFSLKVGQSLRESIEKGLKECKKCILILSPNFLTNMGWTKSEFNTIFTREIIETKNLILPVWFNVDKHQIFEYSPILVDRVGVNWNKGIDIVVEKLHQALIAE